MADLNIDDDYDSEFDYSISSRGVQTCMLRLMLDAHSVNNKPNTDLQSEQHLRKNA